MTRRVRSHPTNQTLLVYCEGEASAEEIARVEAHIGACSHCRRWCEQVGAGVEAMRGLPLVPLDTRRTQKIQANLEAAFIANVARWKEQAVDPTIVMQFLNQSRKMQYRDRKALHWARMACWLAERCESSTPGGAATLFDLRARAWGRVGQALRVAGRLRASAAAFKHAFAYAAQGSGDPPLRAQLQQFEDAIALLDEVGAGWLRERVLALVLRTSSVGIKGEEDLVDHLPEVGEGELKAATVSLNLIAVYAKLGLRAQTRDRIAEILPLFNSLRTGREALASLIQLQQPDAQTQALQLIRALPRELDAGPKLSPSAGEWDRSGGDGAEFADDRAGYDDDT